MGVVSLEAANTHYISPPQYAIWLPPNTPHSAYSQAHTLYVTLLVANPFCNQLPNQIKLIEITPILISIIQDFVQRGIKRPNSAADLRLSHVIIDQIQQAICYDRYLP